MELKNVNSTSVEIWAKCHGAEDFYRVEFPYRLDSDDPLGDTRVNDNIKVALKSATFFDPTKISK